MLTLTLSTLPLPLPVSSALVANLCMGALPPVDRRAVCLVRAMMRRRLVKVVKVVKVVSRQAKMSGHSQLFGPLGSGRRYLEIWQAAPAPSGYFMTIQPATQVGRSPGTGGLIRGTPLPGGTPRRHGGVSQPRRWDARREQAALSREPRCQAARPGGTVVSASHAGGALIGNCQRAARMPACRPHCQLSKKLAMTCPTLPTFSKSHNFHN